VGFPSFSVKSGEKMLFLVKLKFDTMATKFLYLVPIDFTPVTENALVFALDAAKYNKGEVVLLHIISHAKERISSEKNLRDLAAKYENPEVSISTRVVIGKVLRDIGIIADSIGVQLQHIRLAKNLRKSCFICRFEQQCSHCINSVRHFFP
jgi:hypothetical protein